MTRILISITSFIFGVLVTSACAFLLWQQTYPSQSHVWITDRDIKLDNGMAIPRDVELVQERWMPEGFVTLKLYVNVDGDALEMFKQRTEPYRNLAIPYWVEQ